MSGAESSSLLVKDKASLDNSAQFFLFKGKFNCPGFHCSIVASKYFFFFFCLSCNMEARDLVLHKPETLCSKWCFSAVVLVFCCCCCFSCVAVSGVSPSFLGTTGSCPLWSGLIPYIISCHLSKPIYKTSADPGIQAKLSFHEKTDSLEMHSLPASFSKLLKRTWKCLWKSWWKLRFNGAGECREMNNLIYLHWKPSCVVRTSYGFKGRGVGSKALCY